MDEALRSTDPVVPAAAALAIVRKLRLHISGPGCYSMIVSCPGVLTRVSRVVAHASESGLFCEAALDGLHECVSFVEGSVTTGTKVGYETYDAWDGLGEITIFHRVEMVSPEAGAASTLLAELNRLASLVARTLDLVEARSIIHGSYPAGTPVPLLRHRQDVQSESPTSSEDSAGG